jgi:hypothetical protein
MIEQKILQNFFNLKDPHVEEWLDLLKKSIHFTPKEKALFIVDFRYYKPEQIQKFIKALQTSQEVSKKLKEDHPEEYQKRIKWFEEGWVNMIDYLEEVIVDNKIKEISQLNDQQIKDIRQKLQDNF